ncbi:MAG: histidinol-phosphate transaminase [Francisellaceae bacterium]
MSFEALIREDLHFFSPYQSARSQKIQGKIWLNANESPFARDDGYNRYPQPQPSQLLTTLSQCYGVDEDQLVMTRGSDEGIDLLCRLFCQCGKDVIVGCEPTFGMYRVCASLQGLEYLPFYLSIDRDFKLDAEALLAWIPPRCKIVFLCSPNNPTGMMIDRMAMEMILSTLESRCLVVVDEAYVEFSSQDSYCDWISRFGNLVILRTLSKAYALAGIRLGSVIANKRLINWLKRIISPYPIAAPVEKTALSALADLHDYRQQTALIKKQRQRMIGALSKLAVVEKVWSSEANFILVKFHRPIYEQLLKAGIVVRSMALVFDDECMVRISIGLEVENTQLLRQLQRESDNVE